MASSRRGNNCDGQSRRENTQHRGYNKTNKTKGKRNQRRATKFRTRSETTRQIKLINFYGNIKYIRQQQGKLNITRHHSVLDALAKRALRFRRDGQVVIDPDEKLFEEAIDETGTVVQEPGSDSNPDSGEEVTSENMAKILEQEEIVNVSDELLRVHGVPPQKKKEGCMRFIYENPDGINNRISGNEKLEKARDLIDELEADVVAYSEHRQNLKHKDNNNGFSQLFNGGEAEVRSVVGHNVHENVSRVQQGGTRLASLRRASSAIRFSAVGL